MFDGAIAGLQLLTPTTVFAMLIGVVVCQGIAILPGLGGHLVLVMLLPFTYALDPAAAIAMMIGAAATAGTGNTITSVFFGVPGSPTSVATVFDGYPLAKQGYGIKAVSAGLSASLLGGLIGAAWMALALPIVRPLVLTLGSPEYFILVLGALIVIATISRGSMIKGVVAGGLGLLLSLIGQESSSATLRYTGDFLFLWDGLDLPSFFIGIYAVSEMMDLLRKGGAIAQGGTLGPEKSGTWSGIRETLRRPRVLFESSGIGIFFGLVPGIGAAAAQFVTYSRARSISKDKEKFGKGAIDGVIAVDAANNSIEGGALIPTLAFAIPGTAGSAILIGAFLIHGIQPGPEMMTTHLDLLWMIIWVLCLSNIVATSIGLGLARSLARLVFLPSAAIIPSILLLSVFGAYVSRGRIEDVFVAFIFGLVGYWMKRNGYSRETLAIGFVLGAVFERHFILSVNLYGGSFLMRPGVLIIVGAAVAVWISMVIRKRARGRAKVDADAR